MIGGLLEATSGSVEVLGERITPSATQGKSALGLVPQDIALYPDLSASENLTFFGRQIGSAVRRQELARFEVIRHLIVAGGAEPYEASNVVRITHGDDAGNYDPSGVEFVNTYYIVEVDGQLLISNHTTMATLDE